MAKSFMADDYMEYLVRTKTVDGYPVAGPNGDPHAAMERMKARLLRSRRYLVDDDVAVAASQLATCNPEVLAELLPSARAPHHSVWLEWDHTAQLNGTGLQYENDRTCPSDRLAALIEQVPGTSSRFTVDLILRHRDPRYRASNRHGFAFSVLPIGFIYDTDDQLPSEAGSDHQKIALNFRISQTALAASLIGLAQIGSLTKMPPRDAEFYDAQQDSSSQFEHRFPLDVDGRVVLSDAAKARFDITDEELDARYRVCIRVTKNAKFTLNEKHRAMWAWIEKLRQQSPVQLPPGIANYLNTIQDVVSHRSGCWSFIMVLLAMMANPELVDGTTLQRAGKGRLVDGKFRPYLEHRVLKLRLTRQRTVESTIRTMAGRLSPRRHAVAGHWKSSQRRGNPECNHAWVSLTDNRQSCALCERLRWWVTSFERGDASRGYVTKDHQITL